MKKENSIEVANKKEEYGNLLREETTKWKIEREELENEISKLKKNKPTTTKSNSKPDPKPKSISRFRFDGYN